MVEISSTRATPPSPPLRPSVGSVELAVRLLQPLDQLLEAGQTAKAEVLQLREAANSFQLVLRLQLDNGQSSTLQAQSSRPLPIGEQVLLTAVRAKGTTELRNAAIEPEIMDLINILQKMGAVISVDADRVIRIKSGQAISNVVNEHPTPVEEIEW